MTAAVSLVERLAEALAGHRWESVPNPTGLCSCGELPATQENFGRWVGAWRAHVARALLPVVEQAVAEARGEVVARVESVLDFWGPSGSRFPSLRHLASDLRDAIATTEEAP